MKVAAYLYDLWKSTHDKAKREYTGYDCPACGKFVDWDVEHEHKLVK